MFCDVVHTRIVVVVVVDAGVNVADGVCGEGRLERRAESGGTRVGRQEGRVEQGGQRDVGERRRLRGNGQVDDGMLVSSGGDVAWMATVVIDDVVRQVDEEKGDGGGHGETSGQVVAVRCEQTDLRAWRHDDDARLMDWRTTTTRSTGCRGDQK